MRLWIRSQNKERLEEVSLLYLSKISNGYYEIKGNFCSLGEYTKERALEVLDEIQKLIKPEFKIDFEYDDSQPIMNGEWLKSLKAERKIEELSCYVYEMPQR